MSTMRFLFWNVHREGEPLMRLAARLACHRRADIVMLAECVLPEQFSSELTRACGRQYRRLTGALDRVEVFSHLSTRQLKPEVSYRHLTLWQLAPYAPDDEWNILLGTAHLPSPRELTEEVRAWYSTSYNADVSHWERKLNHRRTIIVGDLNMNPFSPGLCRAHCFHAVSSRDVAGRRPRRFRDRRVFHRFFNPMWGLLGDRKGSIPGTYFLASPDLDELHWNMYDQVLIRPDLMERVPAECVEVLTNVKGESLLSRSRRPDSVRASDHLPISFLLDLPEKGYGYDT
jgi:hypothetical protein